MTIDRHDSDAPGAGDLDRLDALLHDAAADYRLPTGPIPREEMWAAIAAAVPNALDSAAFQAAVAREMTAPTDVALQVPSIAPRRTRLPAVFGRSWRVAAMPIAACALVGVGVLIGKWMNRPAPSAAPSTVASAALSADTQRASDPVDEAIVDVPDITAPDVDEPDATPRVEKPAHKRAPAKIKASVAPPPTVAYYADVSHLLAAFEKQSHKTGKDTADAAMAAWARDLLSRTQLLLDSRVGQDTQRRKLLLDLELVLAQMVQLSPPHSKQDLELIERAIREVRLIPRVKSVLPSREAGA